jgi:hypothetical protein
MRETSLYCDLNGSDRISQQISELKGWHRRTMAQLRKMILDAEPDIREEWQWGTAVWLKDGSICNAIMYKDSIRLTFPKGSELADPNSLFSNIKSRSSERSITIKKGESINEAMIQEMIRQAITFNILGDLFNKESLKQKNFPEGAEDLQIA